MRRKKGKPGQFFKEDRLQMLINAPYLKVRDGHDIPAILYLLSETSFDVRVEVINNYMRNLIREKLPDDKYHAPGGRLYSGGESAYDTDASDTEYLQQISDEKLEKNRTNKWSDNSLSSLPCSDTSSGSVGGEDQGNAADDEGGD